MSVPGLAAGTTVVGDFKTAITLFDRGQTSVFVTDSHADFFLRNQLVILAEARMLAGSGRTVRDGGRPPSVSPRPQPPRPRRSNQPQCR